MHLCYVIWKTIFLQVTKEGEVLQFIDERARSEASLQTYLTTSSQLDRMMRRYFITSSRAASIDHSRFTMNSSLNPRCLIHEGRISSVDEKGVQPIISTRSFPAIEFDRRYSGKRSTKRFSTQLQTQGAFQGWEPDGARKPLFYIDFPTKNVKKIQLK